ncbi:MULTISPECIES: DUF2309 domain-containing protein [Microbacterium]|uniref:DUF2309 domain-containing protein n=1 Tax=Microbacterium TaxID=33882 RepID=UPI0027846627|nr:MULTISPECIES: DUF2309 domain-containing protein [Microbacterium]MDQ1082463.1 uncharacterized protein YbcC (UPF0753/DUF2309 family) [Microbacterium sp. SORGH_AS_0344]MDQ1168765.1 uncharacterized protein YbcC (UPF0753/DUF2309 family) [Microbacterium proteolyticum]
MTALASSPSPAVIRGWVAAAGRSISPHFPLETFIARNPVAAYESLDWDEAIQRIAREHGILLSLPEQRFRDLYGRGRITPSDLHAALRFTVPEARSSRTLRIGGTAATVEEVLGHDLLVAPPMTAAAPEPTPAARLSPRLHARIDDLTGRWIASALGTAPWSRTATGESMWSAWRRLAGLDPTLSRRVRHGIRTSPVDPAEAIGAALRRWEIDGPVAESFLRAHVLAQPGWAGLVRHTTAPGVDLVALVAIRTTLECLLLPSDAVLPKIAPSEKAAAGDTTRVQAVARALGVDPIDTGVRRALAPVLALLDPAARLGVWQEAFERGVARDLVPATVPAVRPSEPPRRPLAQAVFCIDTRSESFRRRLEERGDIETLGFAGFFAAPISFRPADGSAEVASCPVLLTPRVAITESSVERDAIARWKRRRTASVERDATVDALKESAVAPYAFAETAGWLLGAASAVRTLAPEGWRALVSRVRLPKPHTHVDANVVFTLEERVLYAETALRMMGLTGGFAPIVLLCGHGATVSNNPFASALQCGACGGHEGEPNARAAAMIFNDPETRAALAGRGIRIPADTLFVAAQMDTVTDEVALLEPWAIPATHETAVLELTRQLEHARIQNTAERSAGLPGAGGPDDALRDTERRSADWAEAYAEWGLAGNAAFIVGPRSITAGVDLGRRAFLHSYDAAADPDGSGLETILTAPMIVAQWINAQYTASTVAPDRFGAGPKPLHNVVGTVGVLSGYGGDLRLGLPWQSVGVGRAARHEPIRLQVFVQAPLARVNDIIDASESVRTLVTNRWIALRVREHASAGWMRWGRYGWQADDLDTTDRSGVTATHGHRPTTEEIH